MNRRRDRIRTRRRFLEGLVLLVVASAAEPRPTLAIAALQEFPVPRRETQGGCTVDTDCPLGEVCETTVVGDCDSTVRECVAGCRIGERDCAFASDCVDVVCKTCPCPDLCEPAQACGSRGLAACPDGKYCHFPVDARCGSFDVGGFCRSIPADCPASVVPVCGCDGTVYWNGCLAAQKGVSPAPEEMCGGVCKADPELLSHGGFEDQEAVDWNFSYRRRGQTRWRKNRPDGHPEPDVLHADDPEWRPPVRPYCGDWMLRISDLGGDKHETRARRSFELDRDLPCGGMLRLRWGTSLEDPGHSPDAQPYFSIELKRRNKTLGDFEADASEASEAAGWVDLNPSGRVPIWYLEGEFTYEIGPAAAGTRFEVIAVAADCSLGDHGGEAYLDCLEIVDSCSASCPTPFQGPRPDPVIPNVFTPEGDGVNDLWLAKDVLGACWVEVELRNRWGRRTAFRTVSISPDADGAEAVLWDGQKGRKGKRPAPMRGNPYYYILRFVDCQDDLVKTGVVYLFRCRDLVSSGEHTYKRKGKAKRRARRDWRQEAEHLHGRRWAKWRRASDRSLDCSKANKKWTCRASGRPCSG